MTIPLSALVAPRRLDPEADLTGLGVDIPKYLAEALRAEAGLRRCPLRKLVVDALKTSLMPELVGEAYRQANGGTR